jgi:hypothetical protein
MNHKVPSEKVCRDLLLNLPKMTATQLRRINKKILEIQAVFEGPREVMLNFDDTVVTVWVIKKGAELAITPVTKVALPLKKNWDGSRYG